MKGNVQLTWNPTLCSEQGVADESFTAVLSMNVQLSLRWKTQTCPSPFCPILPGAFWDDSCYKMVLSFVFIFHSRGQQTMVLETSSWVRSVQLPVVWNQGLVEHNQAHSWTCSHSRTEAWQQRLCSPWTQTSTTLRKHLPPSVWFTALGMM